MLVLLTILLIAGAFAQTPSANDTGQKPTEKKQGGEYSGFEETKKQTEGLPTNEASPTPQAPISGVNPEQNQSTKTAGAVEPASPFGISMLAGIGAAAAGGIVAAAWYFKKSRSS
jgi:hypothetical protein